MHRSVARTLLAEGRLAEADASLAKAAELYRQLQLRTELANCHWMRGYVYAQNGELERAEERVEAGAGHALRAARRPLQQPGRRRAGRRAAPAGASPRRPPRCCTGCSGDLSSERGAVHSAGAHRLLGIIAEDARDTEAAEEHYVRALSLLERAGAAGDLADLCRLLGDLLRRTGRVEAALDAYRTGLGHRTAPGTPPWARPRPSRRCDQLRAPGAVLPFRRFTPAGRVTRATVPSGRDAGSDPLDPLLRRVRIGSPDTAGPRCDRRRRWSCGPRTTVTASLAAAPAPAGKGPARPVTTPVREGRSATRTGSGPPR